VEDVSQNAPGKGCREILRTLILNKPLRRCSGYSLLKKAAGIVIHSESSPNNNLLCTVFAENAEVPG